MIEYVILFVIAVVANGLSAFRRRRRVVTTPYSYFLGLPFNAALGTHKIASVALGIGSTARYWREKVVELRFALFIIGFGLPGVILGAGSQWLSILAHKSLIMGSFIN